jgi:hypothetical protein
MCHRIGRAPISSIGFGRVLDIFGNPRSLAAGENDALHPLRLLKV